MTGMGKIDWRHLTNYPAVRSALVVVGFILIGLTPLVGPIPGPGGVVVFAAGLTLVLRYSAWAKRYYVRFKRRHPKKGDWADSDTPSGLAGEPPQQKPALARLRGH